MISTKDFTFPPSLIGFDYLFDELKRSPNDSFPRHNLIKVDDERMYLEMALAGYSDKDITVDVEENLLTVKSDKVDDDKEYIHKGISTRAFKKQFRLGEYVVVDSADFVDGLLYINLKVVLPEEKKPRQIPVLRKGERELLTE